MSKSIVVANWKMNLSTQQSIELTNQLLDRLHQLSVNDSLNWPEIVLCPSFVAISEVAKLIEEFRETLNIHLGGQDVFWEEWGPFTGEVSVLQLKEWGCRFCLLGHSERRKFLHETDEQINKKLLKVLQHQLTPILCLGETLAERQQGKTQEVVVRQLKLALKDLEPSARRLIIAYEPVWAIHPSKLEVKPAEVEEVVQLLRSELKQSNSTAEAAVLYGGSVKADQLNDFVTTAQVEGVLVGHASLTAENFLGIVREVSK